MALTVRQCLEIDAWKGVKVVAGEQGLDRNVSFINIMEVPEVVRWMKGGELLLTAGYAFKDHPKLQKELVDDLARKQVAGLGIKPGQYLKEIPPAIIEHANQVGLPILELPQDLPYMELMLPVFEIMINYQLYQLKRAEDIHNQLLEVILSGGGFAQLCQSLSELVNNPVLIMDKAGECLACFPQSNLNCDFGVAKVLENWGGLQNCYEELGANRWHSAEISFGDKSQPVALVPIELNDGINGFLVAVECNKRIDEHDARALEYAGTIAALVFAKEKAIFEAERQIKGELVEDLISGNFQYEEVVIRRAGFLNFNVKKPLAVFILDIDGFQQYFVNVAHRNEDLVQELKREILQISHSTFFDYPGGAMLQMKSDSIVGLVAVENAGDQKKLRDKCRQLTEQVKRKHLKVKVSIGVGRVYSGIRNIKKSHEEAEVALRVGRHLYGGSCVSFFEDLGAYRVLYQLKESEAASSFQNETLNKIKLYDAQNDTALYETLVCYLKNNLNFRRTAEEMFVHRNSVIYRIKKIEEITGLSLNDPEARFNLQLSIKLDNILS